MQESVRGKKRSEMNSCFLNTGGGVIDFFSVTNSVMFLFIFPSKFHIYFDSRTI